MSLSIGNPSRILPESGTDNGFTMIVGDDPSKGTHLFTTECVKLGHRLEQQGKNLVSVQVYEWYDSAFGALVRVEADVKLRLKTNWEEVPHGDE
ncbi:MAG: hypothetical protein AAFX93_14025 [Verrucomicrobiota bacterium]